MFDIFLVFGLLRLRVGRGIREAQVHLGTSSNSADPIIGAERDAHCGCSYSLKGFYFIPQD